MGTLRESHLNVASVGDALMSGEDAEALRGKTSDWVRAGLGEKLKSPFPGCRPASRCQP